MSKDVKLAKSVYVSFFQQHLKDQFYSIALDLKKGVEGRERMNPSEFVQEKEVGEMLLRERITKQAIII